MNKYKVRLVETRYGYIDVYADNEADAMATAQECAMTDDNQVSWFSDGDEIEPTTATLDPLTTATEGDFGPADPWNGPGMSVSDFIR